MITSGIEVLQPIAPPLTPLDYVLFLQSNIVRNAVFYTEGEYASLKSTKTCAEPHTIVEKCVEPYSSPGCTLSFIQC